MSQTKLVLIMEEELGQRDFECQQIAGDRVSRMCKFEDVSFVGNFQQSTVLLPDKMTGSLENVSITPRTIWRFPTSKKTVPSVEFQTRTKTQRLRINCHDNTRCGPSKHFSTARIHALGVMLIRPLDHTSSPMLERLYETTIFVSNDIFNEDTIKASDTTRRGRYY